MSNPFHSNMCTGVVKYQILGAQLAKIHVADKDLHSAGAAPTIFWATSELGNKTRTVPHCYYAGLAIDIVEYPINDSKKRKQLLI